MGRESFWKGKKLPKNIRKKISKALKGKQPKNSINWKGENHPLYGKKRLKATRKKLVTAERGEAYG